MKEIIATLNISFNYGGREFTMPIEDYIDQDYEFDEYNATCKYCNKSGLRWEKQDNGKWRLMELDINMCEFIHNCRRLI